MVTNNYEGLIEPELLQKLQDFFCQTNAVYLACIDKEEGVITKAYGSVEDKKFIFDLINKDTYMSLLRKLNDSDIESIVEEPLELDYLKMSGVSVKIDEDIFMMWVVIGIIGDRLSEEIELPDDILTTTMDRYEFSIEFLEIITRQILESKKNERKANSAMKSLVESERELKFQLERIETINEIVKLLESEAGFSEIVDEALERVCDCLDVSAACLVRPNMEKLNCDIISCIGGLDFSMLSIDDIPFFKAKPYMISSDSMKPGSFDAFFSRFNISAAVFQPIEVNEKVLMYLCFFMINKPRVWSIIDIKFINDVKSVIQSVLSKRITKNSLASSYNSLEAILENAGCGIYVADIDRKKILYMNQRFKELYRNTIDAGNLESSILFDKASENYFEEVFIPEEDKWFDVHKTKISWVDGSEVRLCTIYDITDKKKYQQKIENQANNDFLTGLYNRMRCEQDLEIFIRKAEVLNGQGALIYIDIDDFKHINDGLGHLSGDMLLKAVSHSMTRIDGVGEHCYRMGGDEFIVIIPDISQQDIHKIIRDIQNIFVSPWLLKGEDYYCTSSLGISFFPNQGNTVDEVIRKADMALFAAKKKGKNCVEFYDCKLDDANAKQFDLEKNMRNATLNSMEEFAVYFQPIMDVSGKIDKCVGAEALVRWNSASMGFVKPVDFIPLAEYLGLINPIGEHVLLLAAKHCKYWNDMGHPNYKVNVNLSVVQLLQNDIVKRIKNVLDETGVNPHNIRLEVTESLAVNDMIRMKRILKEIKALGVGVALDDFGTGYSSLNHIREMPIDVIKIDKCFIEHLGQDDFSNAFVNMIGELANTIGVNVCVEGVETQEQYEIIKSMGIDLIQGYYFDKPLDIETFEKKYCNN